MKNDINRRDFLKESFWVLGAAGAATAFSPHLGPRRAYAQTQSKSVRRADRYEDSFIFERKPFKWPGDKTLAVWIIPNVEVWHYDSPVGQAVSPNVRNIVPDVINYAWREYGLRVGLWRIA
ncbi:MAG: twin-arginine translocation signal domain-containing protein, partial [Deltaproteobacteria bacterium]|nr:twin-arginine translocation signal domain-containing protein [Deltaproteobacteria bacterium]